MDEATSTRQARVLFDHAEKDPVTADPDGTLNLPSTAYTKHRWAELKKQRISETWQEVSYRKGPNGVTAFVDTAGGSD
jgi:hypothetical protein